MSKHYRPLPSCVTIKKNRKLSRKTGKRELGLYAATRLAEGLVLGVAHIDKPFTLTISPKTIRTPLGGFPNHNINENCILVRTTKASNSEVTWVLQTIREIRSGEELTLKYETYNPVD